MKKLLITIAWLGLSAPWCHAAEEARVFVVFSADIAPYRQAFDGFKEALREKNESVRIVEGSLDKEGGEGIVQQIGKEKPQLIFAIGPDAAKIAKEKTRDIPVVFAMVLSPEPLAGPNVTGVSLEITARAKLERIKRILPNARRIGIIYSPGSAHLYREVVHGCKAVGLQPVGKDINSGKELAEGFRDMARQIDLFLMIPDTKLYFPKSIEYLLIEALKNNVPVIGLAASYTRAGALISFEADYRDLGRQAGEIAIRIIGGEKPQNIEPSRPRTIKTSVNLVVAERLGIKIDPQVTGEASDVFK